MKVYIISLIIGVLVGVLYSLSPVRSPAPPVWALVGLLGMLIGEQLVPFVKENVMHQPPTAQTTTVESDKQSEL